jgi:hypothetical protein
MRADDAIASDTTTAGDHRCFGEGVAGALFAAPLPAGLADGAATGDWALYASINSFVMLLASLAYITGVVCGLDTSSTTAYPLFFA